MSIKNYIANDIISLIKADGTEFDEIKAGVLDDVIISAENHSFEIGDKIIRPLPNGLNEIYLITDVKFRNGTGRSIPDHYSISFAKRGVRHETGNNTQSIVINGNRVYLNSTDNSENYSHSSRNDAEVFVKMRSLLEKIENPSERQGLEKIVRELADVQGDDEKFYTKYKEFMGLAANHAALLGPIFPAIAALLP